MAIGRVDGLAPDFRLRACATHHNLGDIFMTSPDVFDVRTAQWQRIRGKLRAEFGDGVFRSWLKPMMLSDMDAESVTIGVPTRFMRDRVNALYGDRLRALWGAEEVFSVLIVVSSGVAARAKPAIEPDVGVGLENGADDAFSTEPVPSDDLPDGLDVAAPADEWITSIGASLDQRLTFDNFVVGKPNQFAHAACRRVADANEVAFNPLFLYGPVGMGKTHLMHAIAWHIRQRSPQRRVLYISAETFMYQFIRAVRFRDTVAFKEQFRSVDVLMVDDVQFICGRESTQEEFFHTFNALVDQGRQVVISADKSPSDLEGLEERLRSRLGWGLVADLHPTDYELRLSILEAKAGAMNLAMPKPVMEFIAHRISSSVRELEGALNRLVAHSELVGRELTIEATHELLRDVLRANDRRVTIDDIQRRVAEHYNIRLADMSSPRRARAVARPRQIAMYLAKQLTTRSLPEIGRKFGGRDHTTVMHAVKKVDELQASDRGMQEDIELLRRMLGG
jgi:chromosomal replication initiator protein